MKANEGNRNLQEGKNSQLAGIWKKSDAVDQWVLQWSPPLKQISSILLEECQKFL